MGKNKIGIIIGREFSIRVKKKSFILSTILTPLLFAGLMVVPALMAMYSDNDTIQNIKVVDESGIVMPYLEKEVIFMQPHVLIPALLKVIFLILLLFIQ